MIFSISLPSKAIGKFICPPSFINSPVQIRNGSFSCAILIPLPYKLSQSIHFHPFKWGKLPEAHLPPLVHQHRVLQLLLLGGVLEGGIVHDDVLSEGGNRFTAHLLLCLLLSSVWVDHVGMGVQGGEPELRQLFGLCGDYLWMGANNALDGSIRGEGVTVEGSVGEGVCTVCTQPLFQGSPIEGVSIGSDHRILHHLQTDGAYQFNHFPLFFIIDHTITACSLFLFHLQVHDDEFWSSLFRCQRSLILHYIFYFFESYY